jgi:hypothetical protein
MQVGERIYVVRVATAPRTITVRAPERNGIVPGVFSEFGGAKPAWRRSRS